MLSRCSEVGLFITEHAAGVMHFLFFLVMFDFNHFSTNKCMQKQIVQDIFSIHLDADHPGRNRRAADGT